MNSIYSKILCLAGIITVALCIAFEAFVLIKGNDRNTAVAAEADISEVYELSEADEELLTRFVCIKAENEPFICKVAVAAVVFNRIESEGFPDTVSSVILGSDGFGLTDSDLQIEFDVASYDSASSAVALARRGQDPSGGATGFHKTGSSNGESIIFRAADMEFTY